MNKNNYFVLVIAVSSALAQLSLLSGVDGWQFSRTEIDAGQWWRLITGNIVHLTWRHWMMNIFGLIAIVLVYPNIMRTSTMLWVFLGCCLSVTLGIWIFSAEVLWYVGLSGALHGLLICLLVLDYLQNRHFLNVLIFFAIVAKLVWEGLMGPIPGSVSMAGGQVLVQSHWYGFIGGLLITVCLVLLSKNKKINL